MYRIPVRGLVRKSAEVPLNVYVWDMCPSIGMVVLWVVYKPSEDSQDEEE